MSNVFNIFTKRHMSMIGGKLVITPTCRSEYLQACKEVLEEEDYEDVLKAVSDTEYYDRIDEAYKKIVDAYFSFPY